MIIFILIYIVYIYSDLHNEKLSGTCIVHILNCQTPHWNFSINGEELDLCPANPLFFYFGTCTGPNSAFTLIFQYFKFSVQIPRKSLISWRTQSRHLLLSFINNLIFSGEKIGFKMNFTKIVCLNVHLDLHTVEL